ncbi:MAG: hypothetical protein ACI8RD_005487 [Bacillariaceae sp.]|jgi:hypothetical protein
MGEFFRNHINATQASRKLELGGIMDYLESLPLDVIRIKIWKRSRNSGRKPLCLGLQWHNTRRIFYYDGDIGITYNTGD